MINIIIYYQKKLKILLNSMNLFKSRGTKIFTVLLVILTVTNVLLFIFPVKLFPAYGGFTRQVVFNCLLV